MDLFKRIMASLLAPVMLLLAVSCGEEKTEFPGTENTSSEGETTDVPDTAESTDGDKRIWLVKNGEPSAVIVRAAKSSDTVGAAVSKIRSYIKDISGCRLTAGMDDVLTERGDVEIIVGYTNRRDKEDSNIGKTRYSISAEENNGKTSVYILGYEDIYTLFAAECFIAECIESSAEGVWVNKDLKKAGHFSFNDYETQGLSVVQAVANISLTARNLSNKASSLRTVTDIHALGMLTGECSINRTRTTYNLCGTDLGFPVLHNGKLWFFFGDSFSGGDRAGGWRTNTAAYTTDFDFENGIKFDGMYSTTGGFANELITGMKKPKTEYSKIPTGGVSIGDTIYFFFMSVREWHTEEGWDCNYGGLAKSTDDGKTWKIVDGVSWDESTKFLQISPALNPEDGKVYMTGIRGGRKSQASMMRVDADKIEQKSAYEYLVGYLDDGTPVWQSGEEAMKTRFALIDAQVSENTIAYNEYLGEWMISYKRGSVLCLYTSKNPAGPYAITVEISIPSIGSGLYGGFTCPGLMRENGRKVIFVMSTWDPCYNTFLLEVTLGK